jgi:hypothetical protein
MIMSMAYSSPVCQRQNPALTLLYGGVGDTSSFVYVSTIPELSGAQQGNGCAWVL